MEEEIEAMVREKIEEQGDEHLEHIEREIANLFDKEVVTEEAVEPVLKMVKEEENYVEAKEKIEEPKRETDNKIDEILEQMDTKETYTTYKVYIVRENDSLETIIEKYDTTREILSMYNDLSELKIGDKIMIPSQNA